MLWNYNDDYRDEFSKGIHRDILIVPHATKVTPVPGGPPTITNRRPIFDWNSNTNKYEPRKNGNDFVLDDVEWTITNDDIVKEKFKYTYSLNSEQNLTFSSCNAAMIQFTIRNKKEYVEEEDDEGNGTGNWYWEQEIPNLYKKEYTKKDPDGTERIVTGEVLSHACIKLYMYINGDSSTIQYMGMFTVEEDKLVDGGYNRQITAYDFLATFRDMDIFNWYKHLFIGINKYDNDLEDATSDSKEETTKPDDYDDKENWVREKREKWTIGDAIKDLFTNIAAYDMAVFEEDENGNKVMTKGATDGNPNDYGRDGYPEGNRYSGFGMPIKLDDDLFNKSKKYSIPDEPGSNKHECYGYMDILELEFYQNPKIMKAESLSFGKFLEDVGMLAGRYPYIRLDDLEENDYFDPTTIPSTDEHKYDSRYNNYERCILTFKPLPSSDNDSKVSKIPEMEFSNHELAKGFQHEYWPVEDIAIFKIPLDDGTEITYKRLDKEQRVAESKSLLQTFTMPNNMFASYLVTKSDDDEVKKMLEKYKVIREDLFGKETSNGNMSAGAKFQPGYLNMRSRTYVPFQLTTYCDFVRECGDRILINFNDKITGEITTFYSYILERSIEGIQKMMDTYTANGNVRNPIFANYQASLKSGSSSDNQNGQNLGLMTPFDLVEYMRNCGYRLLDEPTDCEAKFCKGGDGITYRYNKVYINSGTDWPGTILHDGDTTNPIICCNANKETYEYTASEGDYVVYINRNNEYYDNINSIGYNNSLYIYTANGEWVYSGVGDCFNNACAWDYNYIKNSTDFYEGSTATNIQIQKYGQEYDEIKTNYPAVQAKLDTIHYGCGECSHGDLEYAYFPWNFGWDYEEYDKETFCTLLQNDVTNYTAKYGTHVQVLPTAFPEGYDGDFNIFERYTYIYPGVWSSEAWANGYPEEIKTDDVKPYVQLKWTDPPDITDWEPTPCTWEGTVVIRKEDSAPLHRWDGEKVVNVTTRDKYKTKAYKDKDIKLNRTYYYCFMPYYTIDNSDPEHPIRAYTFTKTIKVETGDKSISSSIDKIEVSGNTATVYYTLNKPDVGQFTNIKIYGKIGSNPSCDDTDDVVVDVDDGSSSKDISGLDYESTYYFCLVTVDSNDEELSSNVVSCTTGESIIPAYLQEVGSYLIGREDNKQSLLTCSMWQNGSYIGRNGWTLPMCLYHPNTNINSDYINLASFPDGATINIDTSNGINVTYTGFTASRMFFQYGYARARIGMSWEANGAPEGSYWAGYESGNDSNYEPTKNDFVSLEDLFEYIYQHFRHVNVVFNGETIVTETTEN